MPTYASSPAPRSYSQDEWNRLARTVDCMMVPILFDDLLAPNLPVDAMRILRHLWLRTWGRVNRNPWMPPERIAEGLPQWAFACATACHVYAVYRDLVATHFGGPMALVRAPATLSMQEPSYRTKRRLWAEAWTLAERQATEGGLTGLVDRYRAELRESEVYPDLMRVTVTQRELAALFGPRNIRRCNKRGRTRGSVRATLRWMEEVGLIVARQPERWSGSVYEFGPEMWHVLTTGDFSTSFRARLRIMSKPSQPFFRLGGRGLTPRADGFDGVPVRLGAHYRVPRVVEVLETHLPQNAMPVVWYVIRNTLGRHPDAHSSLGYVAVANKEMARLYGPVNVAHPTKRGRRLQSVRAAIDWCVAHGILTRKRRGDWTELSLGPVTWHLLRKGEVSPSLSALLGVQPAATGSVLRVEDDLARVERLLENRSLQFRDVTRIYKQMSQRGW